MQIVFMKTLTKERRTQNGNRIGSAVPTARRQKPGIKLEHILVPIDFSEGALHALEAAEDLVKAAHGTITLLYVVEPVPPTSEWAPLEIDTRQLVASLQKKLEALPAKQGIDLQLIDRGTQSSTPRRN